MSKTYLHIGLPKTGTTALQNYMRDHRYLLSQNGLNYPSISELGAPEKANGHHLLAHMLAKSADNIPKVSAFLAKQRADNPNPIFLSAEPLARHALLAAPKVFDTWNDKGRYVERVKSAIGTQDTEIIVTLRQPHDLAESAYKELVKKSRYIHSFKTYLHTRYYGYDFPELITLWRSHFPKVNVRVFENDLTHAEGLVGAMLRPLCPDLPPIAPSKIVNMAWHPHFVEFKRLLNSGVFTDSEMDKISASMRRANRNMRSQPVPSYWTDALLKAFEWRFDKCNIALATRLIESSGDIFAPIAPDQVFEQLTQQHFAEILENISTSLPGKLVEKMVAHLAVAMMPGN